MTGKQYRLRRGVDLVEEYCRTFLLCTFPLKAVVISDRLKTLFRSIKSRSWTSLEELHTFEPNEPIETLEAFLSQLVKRGFLEERGKCSPYELPKVSVIIPVRNRPEDTRNCLNSLREQDYPQDKLEILVVDDASTDDTRDVVRTFQVKLLGVEKRGGASFCRNLGASRAGGDILCFLDSDCTTDPGWLRELISAFRDREVGACGGLVDSLLDDTGIDRYEQVKSSLHMGKLIKDCRSGDRFFYVPSCSLAVRKDVFLNLGGFREEMEVGEDVDLCWRLIDQGFVLEYRPGARVFHRHRNSVWSFCRRRFEYGTSEPLLQELHPGRRKTFMLWPRALVFWFLVAAAGLTGWFVLMGPPLIWLLGDSWTRRQKAHARGLPLGFSMVLCAVVRSNLSFLYHVCSFISRYYLVFVSLATPFWPLFGATVWVAHLGVGLVQHEIKKPRLSILAFLWYFSLEQLSYQAGVWWGCIRSRFFLPVIPRIRIGTAHV